MVSSKT